MGTAERCGTPGDGVATPEAEHDPVLGPDPGSPVGVAPRQSDATAEGAHRSFATGCGAPEATDKPDALRHRQDGAEERSSSRPLWVEEPAGKRRLPDPVRTAAVRAVLIIAVTLIQAMVAFLCTMAGSWPAFPIVLSSVVSTVVATWGVLDVWVTRQVWNQRNGVVSAPSSTARALRRERRRARREARAAARSQERIRQRQGGAGQLSHP